VRSHRQYALFNGTIACKLLLFKVNAETVYRELTTGGQARPQPGGSERSQKPAVTLGESVRMFANRLQKNMKQIDKWAKREGIECYRIYDADLPEYAVAIDRYRDWLHVQEYAPPKSIDPVKAQQRMQDLVLSLPQTTGISASQIVVKERRPQKEGEQYRKLGESRRELEVTEHGCRFLVNLHDYLDTGLFLDHRPIRRWIQQNAKGTRFLNLFCYTGAGTIHAARGGAKRSVSVDMSHTYVNWARRNLVLNGFSEHQHEFVQADCLSWLDECRDQFDLIFLDPPTFSNSKRMEGVLDIQRDHAAMIHKVMKLLDRSGVLIFSNNFRRFQMSEEIEAWYQVTDISAKSIDQDFKRDAKIHRCWQIQWKSRS
jgi:23S rRNA (guanine2445-N2)-methyltransferase / 23S rRNA (guanine2069-N7)-methyltransferase